MIFQIYNVTVTAERAAAKELVSLNHTYLISHSPLGDSSAGELGRSHGIFLWGHYSTAVSLSKRQDVYHSSFPGPSFPCSHVYAMETQPGQ